MTNDEGAPFVLTQLTPGPETKALKRFYKNYIWTGHVAAGAMGPGSPEMHGEGKSTCTWIVDDLWVANDFEQRMGFGDQMITWKAHWITGWDFAVQEYRAVVVDNNGSASLFRGTIEGDVLTMESISDLRVIDQPMKLRFITDATDPENVVWRSDRSISGGPWTFVEEYVMKPAT